MPSNLRGTGDKRAATEQLSARHTFADRLRALIDACDADSDSAFALRCGLSRDRLSKYLSGKQEPTWQSLSKLILGFGAYGMHVDMKDLTPDPRNIRSSADDAEDDRLRGRRAVAPAPVSTRSFEYMGDTTRVRINEVLPKEVADQIWMLLHQAEESSKPE